MKKISQYQIDTLKQILDKMHDIETLYKQGAAENFNNFPYYIGRISGLNLCSIIELKQILNDIQK